MQVNYDVLNPSSCKDVISILSESVEEDLQVWRMGIVVLQTLPIVKIEWKEFHLRYVLFFNLVGMPTLIDNVPTFVTSVSGYIHIYNLMDKFECHNDFKLNKLYNLREKWCTTFSKDSFPEVFYYLKVASEWRSYANMEDFLCNQGLIEMKVPDLKLLQHANGYTIRAYMLFENQFMKFPEYC
ncbi:hypothetical protein M9H77_23988 [Catharanthus roseus]|uniref:Uncharacterized protein n=1 Tax=Catharanthus roseus TaxID=4058 RepID=A0ACC0AWD6_CATRO|nr:hypothetical protein M9H77_23988 [Catharanthus roseus]